MKQSISSSIEQHKCHFTVMECQAAGDTMSDCFGSDILSVVLFRKNPGLLMWAERAHSLHHLYEGAE